MADVLELIITSTHPHIPYLNDFRKTAYFKTMYKMSPNHNLEQTGKIIPVCSKGFLFICNSVCNVHPEVQMQFPLFLCHVPLLPNSATISQFALGFVLS